MRGLLHWGGDWREVLRTIFPLHVYRQLLAVVVYLKPKYPTMLSQTVGLEEMLI